MNRKMAIALARWQVVGMRRELICCRAGQLVGWVYTVSAGMGASLASVGEPTMRVLKDALAEREAAQSPAAQDSRRTYIRKHKDAG